MRSRSVILAILVFSTAAAACNEEGAVTVHTLRFRGVKAVDEARLKSALATRQSSRLPWGKPHYFDRSRFDADLKRIQAFYADRGYPDARVTGVDVTLNDKQDEVDLTVTIDEGEPVRVAGTEFVGFDVVPPRRLSELKSQIPLKVGQPRDRQFVVTAHEMALNEVKDHGYAYARVTTSEASSSDGKQATLTFTAEPGKLAHFGPIQIQGNKTVDNRVIERQLTFRSGDLYRRTVVQDSQRRLYGMELFQFVNIETLNAERAPARSDQNAGASDPQPELVPTRVTVAEGKHQRVNFGVGYGTEERARVDAEYHHVNFLGGARSAGAHVRYSSLDRGIRLDFNQPYFFGPHFSLGGEAQQWYTYTPAYSSVVQGAKATVVHRTSEKSSWAVSLTSEHDSSLVVPQVLNDPRYRPVLIALGLNFVTGEQNGTLNSFGFDIQHSTADNVLNAHRGYQIAFHAEQAGWILPGTFRYTAVSADARHYQPVGDHITLSSRMQFGNLRPSGNEQLRAPLSKRYFLGGATSIRGWGRYEVGPLDLGLPSGGDSMFAFSEEVRAALHGNLGGVLLLDAGNVWADSWGIRLGSLRYAVGPGLRYQTPIGPIRFDFGYQLNPIPGLTVNGAPQTRRWRVHFSIGQAF